MTAPEQQPEAGTGRRRGGALWMMAPFVLFALLGAVLAVQIVAPGEAPRAALISAQAPALDLPLLDGDGALTRDDLLTSDGPIVVNFWASWCVPCRIEHPALIALGEHGLATVIGVAYRDAPEDSRAFLAELGDPFTKVGVDEDGFAAVSWGVRGVPETFVLSASGEIVYKHSGPIQNTDMQDKILPAIEAARER